MRVMKSCLASWRHSADTAANARTSKVIHGRIRVAAVPESKNDGRGTGKYQGAVDACRVNLKWASCRAENYPAAVRSKPA
jgi:hypothetical protein